MSAGSLPISDSAPPPPGSPPRTLYISLAALLFGVSFAVVLVVTAFVLCCRWRRDRSGGSDSEHTLPSDRCGGDPFIVEASLPAFPYAPDGEDGGAGNGARECAVCLNEVKGGEMVRQLPACLHLFHAVCIDHWLAARRTCPLCRAQLGSCTVEVDPLASVLDDPRAPDLAPV